MAIDIERRKRRQRAYYARRRAEGKCVRCGKQDERTQSGLVYCAECVENRKPRKPKKRTAERREIENKDKREWRQMAKDKGICVSCGAKDKYTVAGKAHCIYCSTKINARLRQRRIENGDLLREQAKARRDKWREQGRCSSCGGRKEEPRYNMCIDCRMRHKLSKMRRENKNGTKQLPRGQDGRCWQCNKAMAMPGKRVCADCYALKIETITKSGFMKGAKA